MAIKESYAKLESIVMEKVMVLESENAKLRQDLALAQAKLDVYERIASISDDKRTLGFGPPVRQEG